MTQPGPDLRLVPAAAAAWTAVWWATGQPLRDVAIALGLSLTLALALLAFAVRSTRGRRSGTVAVATLIVTMVTLELTCTTVRLIHRDADPIVGWAERGLSTTVLGRISADPAPIASRFPTAGQRFVVHVSMGSASAGQKLRAGGGRVVVIGGEAFAKLAAGQHVRVSGRLAPAGPHDAALAVIIARARPVVLSEGSWMWRWANRLRTGLRQACAGLGPDAGGLLPALVVGDTTRLPAQLASDLRTAGLTHLTAVSGANLAIVATAVSAVLGLAGARMRTRVVWSAVSILGFVILARPEPSVLRAAVMGALGLIAVLNARPGNGVPLLCTAVVLLLVADPWLARSFGFALSVLATAGLLVLVPAWVQRSDGAHSTWRQLLMPPIAVPFAALICTAPVTVLLQPRLSAVAVPANLLAGAAVPVATLLGVLAAGLSVISPPLAALAARCGGWATAWIAAVAHWFADVPGAQVPWLPGVAGALVLAAILAVVVVLSLHPSHSLRDGGFVRGRGLLGLLGVIAVASVLALAGLRLGLPVLAGSRVPDDWLVVQCDVGQGSATLLNTGHGAAVLVDTGPDPALASRCLRRQHIRSLDLIAITHFHADHAGGLAGVLPQAGHPPILVSPLARPSEQVRSVHEVAARAGSSLIIGHAGMAGTAGAGRDAVGWQLLYPPGGPVPVPVAAGADDGTVINDSSLALLITTHGIRVLLLGDLETDAQQTLLGSAQIGPVDVVVVAHHGSARQDPQLYASLHARAALIGVGTGNDYGHPAPSALRMLQRLGARVLRTDIDGQLTVAGTAEQMRVFGSR